jgi:7-cyano-7-deazaguanine synthase in queuosine biosynthesis
MYVEDDTMSAMLPATTEKRRAIVLLSGGLDSTTTLAIAKREGYAPYAMTFRYGQRHAAEIAAAKRVAETLGVAEHVVVDIDLRLFGGSALTADIAVPKARDLAEIGAGGIPITYVPARNTIFLSFALAWAEVLGASDIFLGVNALDYSVSGKTLVWVRNRQGANLMPIEAFYALVDDDYETMSVDPHTLQVAWKRVTGRYRHDVSGKRCFTITLERGQEITVTEDHSLFTINPITAALIPVRGADVSQGMPLVVPFDLSDCTSVWARDVSSVSLVGIQQRPARPALRRSLEVVDGYVTNRLGRTRVPMHFPITDEFLYLVGLWLAEGGKDTHSKRTTLAFSVGGIPGAADALRAFFEPFGVQVNKSPANDHDYSVCSSVFDAVFHHLSLLGTAKEGSKRFPTFFWELSQRQRRIVVAGLWDGDGSHVLKHQAILAQKSHALIHDLYHCLTLDGIFPVIKASSHEQKAIVLGRAEDFERFTHLYPLRHTSKRESLEAAGAPVGRDKTFGLWKCEGLWTAVSLATPPAGRKTEVYNAGGKYDEGVRAQRSAFLEVPAIRELAQSRLAFLRVVGVRETSATYMYDLSVHGAENFLGNGILAHNSGYPDCRPEYIAAFERMANLATKAGVEGAQRLTIHTPLIAMTKAQIIQTGLDLGVDYALTLSCYDPSPEGAACGECDACLLRQKGFAALGRADPVAYQTDQARQLAHSREDPRP